MKSSVIIANGYAKILKEKGDLKNAKLFRAYALSFKTGLDKQKEKN